MCYIGQGSQVKAVIALQSDIFLWSGELAPHLPRTLKIGIRGVPSPVGGCLPGTACKNRLTLARYVPCLDSALPC